MIPRHRPPYGIGNILRMMLKYEKRLSVEQLEDEFGNANGIHAVLLPSARAGIYWALKLSSEPDTKVVCPAYTCAVVHEAVMRAGMDLRLVDTAVDGFLMDPIALRKARNRPHALILSEIYGYTYDLPAMGASAFEPSIRIVDMAMSVPHEKLFSRFGSGDFGVISFGIGKSMYAGWGGMGFTRDPGLAHEVRRMRDAALTPSDTATLVKRGVDIFARTLAHESAFYGILRKFKQAKSRPNTKSKTSAAGLPTPRHEHPANEWVSPSTYWDRRLAHYNLEQAGRYYARRIELAHRYHEKLEGATELTRPAISEDALSHYTVRVQANVRQQIRQHLWKSGVDVGALFGFPRYLAQADYPNASKMASEILNLPLGPTLRIKDVDRISKCLMQALKTSHNHSFAPQAGATLRQRRVAVKSS